ncbi:hypothetical protein K469DRAFT_665560 [Zopfia rhizophila CBS 207.26]|uniref:Uncharacterized protein n=1 Tax=Zopfia rhizophila CBS 207.26 TaxID=1314779 RepID=A0A6A6E3U7_9PEZI|nr:hypothetical protein K469DRAFT_665560 [Zopfia rhizophila CBS 207.26]
MPSRHSSRVYEVLKDLNRRQTIPANHRTTLEERLAIACKPLTRQPREKVPRARRDVRSYHKRKKAQSVYLGVLDEAPHVFLPFILAISPKACECFDSSDFCQDHKKQNRIPLSSEAKSILEEIAEKHEISQSPHYKRLIELLFPKVSLQPPKPITTTGSDTHWEYHAAYLKGIRCVFGDGIYDTIESAPIRMHEKAITQTLQTTDCARTSVPRQNFQDAIIRLDIGHAREFTRILFPEHQVSTSKINTGK